MYKRQAQSYSTQSYPAQGYPAPIYSGQATQIYQPAVAALATDRWSRSKPNYTVGITGLIFERDYEDNITLASNPAGDQLSTNDADEQNFDGYGLNFASRNQNGRGFEIAYWALNPGSVSAELQGNPVVTSISGLNELIHASTGENIYDIYTYSLTQSITRETDINSLEFNLLRNGSSFTTRNNRLGSWETLGGFRWFEFEESLQYAAFTDTTTYPTLPSEFYYNLRARNRLLGFQGGANGELNMGSKLRLFGGIKGGVYNNNIRTLQNITDQFGEIAQVNSGPALGRPFSYSDEKNDFAFLGELNLGILYQLTCRSRIRLGYRAVSATGVALALSLIHI